VVSGETLHPRRLTYRTWKWWFGRWFSSSQGGPYSQVNQPFIFRGANIFLCSPTFKLGGDDPIWQAQRICFKWVDQPPTRFFLSKVKTSHTLRRKAELRHRSRTRWNLQYFFSGGQWSMYFHLLLVSKSISRGRHTWMSQEVVNG